MPIEMMIKAIKLAFYKFKEKGSLVYRIKRFVDDCLQ